jgi:hypothetical protein
MSFDPPGGVNHFQAPRTGIGEGALYGDVIDNDAELIRRDHLSREANIKSLGQLLYFFAFFGVVGMVVLFSMAAGIIPTGPNALKGMDPSTQKLFFAAMGFGCLVATAFYIGIGYGLTHLQTWARWTVVVLVSLGLLNTVVSSVITIMANPVVGLIALIVVGGIYGLILYLLISSKAGVVFSKEYKEVIRKTPHIKYKISLIVKILLGFLLFIIVLGVLAAIFGPRNP